MAVWDIGDREMGAFGVEGLASAVMEAVERAAGAWGSVPLRGWSVA